MIRFRPIVIVALFIAHSQLGSVAFAKYTTKGKDIVDRKTGERVILRGFGIGGWLLPEGYMWGIRKLDRPRQFEAAIEELIGKEDAAEFWRLYYDNFLIEDDIAAMKAWGEKRFAFRCSRQCYNRARVNRMHLPTSTTRITSRFSTASSFGATSTTWV